MPVSVTMPRLGESVTEGTVTRWLKQEGDRVEVDEPLLEVSTDKVDTEIPSPAAGVLSRIVVREDETVAVGSELAVIAGDGEDAGTAQASAAQPSTQDTPAAAAPAPPARAPADTPAPPAAAAPPVNAAPPAAAQPTAGSTPATTADSGTGAPAAAAGPATEAGTPVKMPALGESVTEGTVTRWLKQVGDSVDVDEPLLEVSTDKVDTELPSPVAGVVLEIKVAEDETAAVGAELAIIGAAGAARQATPIPPAPQPSAAPAPPPPPPAPTPAPPPPAAAPTTPPTSAPTPTPTPGPAPAPAPPSPAPAAASAPAAAVGAKPSHGDGNGYVTPLVRKLAADLSVDLHDLAGTGVGGRIRRQDVLDAAARATAERAAAPQPTAAAPAARPASAASALRGRTEKMSRLRAVIAKRMVESLQVSAQLTTVVEVDVTRIAKLRDQVKADFQARHGVKLSFLPFLALATVEALQQHATVNASINMDEGTVTYHDAEHLGIAVDTERGLVVPVIRNAGDLNLAGLAKRIADLAERTRTNKISPDELSGGTFTLTNTGSRGALFDTPIINQPQVGILGTGAVVKRAVVVDDAEFGEIVAPRSMMYLALSYDHRLVDGADAARFLTTIKERLEAGVFESDLGI